MRLNVRLFENLIIKLILPLGSIKSLNQINPKTLISGTSVEIAY